jgi:hypothetical protein
MLAKRNIILSILWISMGLFVVFESRKLGIGRLRSPGPGLMPLLLGISLVLVSSIFLFQSLKSLKKKEDGGSTWAEVKFGTLGTITMIQLGYGFMIERLGFLSTAFICLLFLFKFGGKIGLGRAFVFAFMTVFCSYIFFAILLKVQLPSFPWHIFF